MMSLHDRFVAALDDLDVPDTDVAVSVLSELSNPDRGLESPEPVSTRSRRALMAMAAALVLLVCIAAITPARDAVARWFGIGSTKIEIVPPSAIATNAPRDDIPTSTASTPASAAPAPATPAAGDDPVINPSTTLDSPTTIVDDSVGRGRTFMWSTTDDLPALGDTDLGLILSVRMITSDLDLKRVGADVGVEFVTIEVQDAQVVGLWIDGTHELVAAGTDRAVVAERVLLWESGGVQFRLESQLSKDEALAIASSIAGGTDLLRPG